ncbi:MAG TPA: cell division protein FtsL [Thermoanaerobaculia bacterium]|nr:cell division protein FtsL [Thermoanaerobaculia bacterium]
MPERPARAGPLASSRLKTPYLLPRPPRNRYLVRQRDRRRMRELGRVAVAVLVVGVALLGYTWLHLELLGSGYRVDTLETKLHELERRERHLRLEEAYLSSPQRVEARASKELGMKPPELAQLLFAGGAAVTATANSAKPARPQTPTAAATPVAPAPTLPPNGAATP